MNTIVRVLSWTAVIALMTPALVMGLGSPAAAGGDTCVGGAVVAGGDSCMSGEQAEAKADNGICAFHRTACRD